MTTRVGKIGRLPKSIRDEIGHRIEDGLPGTEIVEWLNAQKEVQGVLAKCFEGRPINEQNLSDWKQSGHGDWVRRQEACAWAGRMFERAGELDATGDQDLSDALATVLAQELGQLGSELTAQCADAKERWGRLRELNRELSLLRRDGDRRERTKHQQERWQWQIDRQDALDEEQEEKEYRERRMNMYRDRMCLKEEAEFLGARAAQRLYRMKHGLSEADLNDGTWEAKEAARQEKIRQWKLEQKRMKNGKHPTSNSRTSASRQQPTSKEDGAETRAKEEDEGGAETAVKTKESRLIKANRSKKKQEAKTEQPRPNVGLAKGTKAGQKISTEKFADRKMVDSNGLGNAPCREAGAPGAAIQCESRLIKANRGKKKQEAKTEQQRNEGTKAGQKILTEKWERRGK